MTLLVDLLLTAVVCTVVPAYCLFAAWVDGVWGA